MLIGFSGSRNGPSPPQRTAFRQVLSGLMQIARAPDQVGEPLIFYHGDCVGWDATAHEDAQAAGLGVILYPPRNRRLRAYCKGAILEMAPMDYLPRNREIVDHAEHVIICPDTPEYRIKSGSWYTFNYARKSRKSLILIKPDGSTLFEPAPPHPQPRML
jgi:hypothetical protein